MNFVHVEYVMYVRLSKIPCRLKKTKPGTISNPKKHHIFVSCIYMYIYIYTCMYFITFYESFTTQIQDSTKRFSPTNTTRTIALKIK